MWNVFMSSLCRKLVIFALCLIVLSCPQTRTELSLEERITNCIVSYKKKWNYTPAISVSVYGQEGKIKYDYATGYSSLNDKTINTIYTPHFVYSITKSFVAASIVKLANENKLSLSDSISNHLSELDLNKKYINLDASIEELLTHRSGINDYTESSSIIYANPFSKTDKWNAKTILSLIETPASNRGEFIYSSANYIILGLIVEKVGGISLNNYLRENFTDNLIIDAKLYPQDSASLQSLAHPHSYPNTFIGLVWEHANRYSKRYSRCSWVDW